MRKKTDRHGHVARHPKGMLCKCMGAPFCEGCQEEIIAHIGPTRGGWFQEAWALYREKGQQIPETLWAMRAAELALELAKVSAALRDVLATTGRYQSGEAEKIQAREHAQRLLVEAQVEE